jgi:predicted Zn-dependent protease
MKKTLLTIIAGIVFITACHKNAVTGKSSLSLVPESELINMSVGEYGKFLAQHPPLPANDERVIMVKRAGERIQKAVEKLYADRNASDDLKGFDWEFNVVNEEVINAWCMPGGKVVVYTGLLPVTQDEKGLAVVMGHEIAHAVARHGNQRMSQQLALQLGGTALSVAVAQKPAVTQQIFSQVYGVSAQLGSLKYSRKHETEADEMGLIFAAMAGYDPEAAIQFWERMSAAGGGAKPPELLSTHPSDDTRISNLKKFMPEAKKYYRPQ